eukprot:5540714-Prymnesium_polylepis.1
MVASTSHHCECGQNDKTQELNESDRERCGLRCTACIMYRCVACGRLIQSSRVGNRVKADQ